MAEKERNNKGERVKKTKKNSSKKSFRVVAVILALAVVITGVAYYTLGSVLGSNWNNMFEYYGEYISQPETDSGDCVFTAVGGEIKDLRKLSGSGLISTGTTCIAFKRNGVVTSAENTGYSSSVIKTAGKNYIVFERSTGKYSIMNNKGKVFSSQLDSEIVNADISFGGNYVIISKKTLSSSLLTVYSAKNEILFQWECNDRYLTDCAISPNGKTLIAASFDVENGEKITKLLVFNTKSVDIEREIDIENHTVYSLKFLSGDSLGIITDENYIIANVTNAETKSFSYEYDSISDFFFSDNSSAVIVRDSFGTLDASTVSVVDRNCAAIMNCVINEKIVGVCCDKSFVYVLCNDKILVYAISTGELSSTIETAGGMKYIAALSGKIYCCSDTDFYCLSR